jgi:hypothetical protein
MLAKLLIFLVGGTGFEPVTPSMSRKCSPTELTARQSACSVARPFGSRDAQAVQYTARPPEMSNTAAVENEHCSDDSAPALLKRRDCLLLPRGVDVPQRHRRLDASIRCATA